MVKLTKAELIPLLVTIEDTQLPQQQPTNNEEVERQQSENAPTSHESRATMNSNRT